MGSIQPLSERVVAATGPLLAAHFNTWVLALVCGLAIAATTSPVAAQKWSQADASSIKRYQFSSDTFEAVKAEFNKRG